MARVVAKCTGGGPLDGLMFSVIEEQSVIYGFAEMKTVHTPALDSKGEKVYNADGSVVMVDTGDPIDKYVKNDATVRGFVGQEKTLFDLLFEPKDHNVQGYCEFEYDSGVELS